MSDLGLDEVTDSEEIKSPGLRDHVRATERENAELKAELERTKRESAFDKAGIPTEGPGALLRETFAGPADPEAVKAAAEKYGIALGTQDSGAGQYDDELDALRRTTGAVRGSREPEVDPMDKFEAKLGEIRKGYVPGSWESSEVSKNSVVDALEDLQRAGVVPGLDVKPVTGWHSHR